jgi:hypothetical protein
VLTPLPPSPTLSQEACNEVLDAWDQVKGVKQHKPRCVFDHSPPRASLTALNLCLMCSHHLLP